MHWAEKEREWKGPFYFIQGADPQFGLMKAWATGDCDNGGDEWEQEIRLAEQAVQAINKLNPKPKFFVLCGDLVHAMPGRPWRKEQTEDLQRVLRTVDSDIPLVLVSGNHDVGNVPTPETIAEFQRTWGDDYFSFWVGGVLFLVLNSQFLYDASRCPALKQEHDHWLDQQLRTAGQRACRHAVVFQHIPLFLQSIGEDDDYFNLTKSVRKEMADKFVEAGRPGLREGAGEGRDWSGEEAPRSFSRQRERGRALDRTGFSPSSATGGSVTLACEPQLPRLSSRTAEAALAGWLLTLQ
uniref:Serine/threonine-protein phosphatase CPPED1 n=1 Tax=Bos mutus grunniens TaxID=30521 RepID=A0A8B9YSP3_BOSMU